jgi:hypothetical protein
MHRPQRQIIDFLLMVVIKSFFNSNRFDTRSSKLKARSFLSRISSFSTQNITHKNNPIVETTGLINQNQLLMKNLFLYSIATGYLI